MSPRLDDLEEARKVSVERLSTGSASSPLLKPKIEDDQNDTRLTGFDKVDAASQQYWASLHSLWHRHRWTLVHLLLLTTYTSIFAMTIFWSNRPTPHIFGTKYENVSDQDNPLNSPIADAVRYQVRTVHNSLNATSKYKGPPTPEVDRAWRNLFHRKSLRASLEQMNKMNRSSVMLGDGSGDFLVTHDTYHQLHCLWYIFQYTHDYDVKPTIVSVSDHIDHCIDSLRIFIQCHATTSVQTYSWRQELEIPWANFEIPNVCVDWDYYDNWVKEHSTDEYEPGMLVHPELGAFFPDGRPNHKYNGHRLS